MPGDWTYQGLSYRRRPTRVVHVGDVSVGGSSPLRVQSMTTPATTDTRATVDQIERLVDAGCEIVRLTVPTSRDADNLPVIRAELVKRRIHVPLVADIHFTPAAAMRAIEHVEKIRINPGNYADKKKFATREYTDTEYETELERIAGVFSPLVIRAQELGVSMRIGTNHGSLSDRIMNRYGDSPEGMVESALEFVRICESHGYHELILSMKASNPVVVLQVYRLLAQRMAELGMDYPFHLGVTEAGDGEDGRVKSAIGIGALLADGIGDTVRVSLTEDPVREIPVARALVDPFNRQGSSARMPELQETVEEPRDPFSYQRRPSTAVGIGPFTLGDGQPVRVEVPLRSTLDDEAGLRRELDSQAGTRVPEETRAEVISVQVERGAQLDALIRLRESMELVAPRVALSARIDLELLSGLDDEALAVWLDATHRLQLVVGDPLDDGPRAVLERLFRGTSSARASLLLEVTAPESAVKLAAEAPADRILFGLTPRSSVSPLHGVRLLVGRLAQAGSNPPLVLLDQPALRDADPLLGPSSMLGGLLCDGIGDSVQIHAETSDESRRMAFSILQAARVRITRTEFISCPSCGRTLFELEETTARIKARTAHLKGLKIAVMGCIVNGPGEMADADFGYVGWGEDKIALFVGKEMVARDIPTAEADERLVQLIKEHGRWVDPPVHA